MNIESSELYRLPGLRGLRSIAGRAAAIIRGILHTIIRDNSSSEQKQGQDAIYDRARYTADAMAQLQVAKFNR